MRWKIKQFSIAYFLCDTSAKNYQNPFMYVIVIVNNISVIFSETQCIERVGSAHLSVCPEGVLW